MLPHVSVRFQCDDPSVQRAYDEAERKCRLNLRDFGGDRVRVETDEAGGFIRARIIETGREDGLC